MSEKVEEYKRVHRAATTELNPIESDKLSGKLTTLFRGMDQVERAEVNRYLGNILNAKINSMSRSTEFFLDQITRVFGDRKLTETELVGLLNLLDAYAGMDSEVRTQAAQALAARSDIKRPEDTEAKSS